MLLEDLIKHHLKLLNGNCHMTHDYYPFSLNIGPTAKLLGTRLEITKIFRYPLSGIVLPSILSDYGMPAGTDGPSMGPF